MARSFHQAEMLAPFKCLGDACEDTCCKGWGMQVTEVTLQRYRTHAPELLGAVVSGEAEHVMKRDAETDYCMQFDKGWCGVQAKYGEDFLGDACHFFPRIVRRFGENSVMTAALSCPEVARLGLFAPHGFALAPQQAPTRLPETLRDYLPAGLEAEKALQLHQFFLQAVGDEAISTERAVARLVSVATSLEQADPASWAVAGPYYWASADAKLPAPEENLADPFNLLNALQGLAVASHKQDHARLRQTIDEMQTALQVELNWQTLAISTSGGSLAAWQAMQKAWQGAGWGAALRPMLRKWLAAQLSMMSFPFAGLGDSPAERASLLGIRFATLKLALMCACAVRGSVPTEAELVRIVQSLARLLDHLADAALSRQIYTETGWLQEARLRSLMGDG